VPKRRGRITVVAGTNGAGKSSIAGALAERRGGGYFDPDLRAADLRTTGQSPEQANAVAWREGYDALRSAVDRGTDFNFETTLGGDSIVRELHRAVDLGQEVHVFYVGLASPELHIERVRARVVRGGHDIPEAKIRERFLKSLANLVSLIGRATSVHILDNSDESPMGAPQAKVILRMRKTRITESNRETLLTRTPEWAKPLVAAALQVSARHRKRRAPKK
jgi:predicted ABC-type ATPase